MVQHQTLGRILVAVPANNEADQLPACLRALADQRGGLAPQVLLFLNNTTDRTPRVLADLLPRLPLEVEVVEHAFPAHERTAGHARRMAMALAAERAGAGGLLLCTDADGQVAPDWLAANLHHLRGGADVVAGQADLDPEDAAAIPARLHDDDARECAYAALLDEIDSLLDPDPADPWPRHTEHSGASIGVTVAAFHRAGGVPAIPSGEDRAFFAALRRVDARIRHATDVRVTVSGRLVGRAVGGMADTIRRRMTKPDPFLDDRLEPVISSARRSEARRRLRAAFRAHDRLEFGRVLALLGCTQHHVEAWAGRSGFGALWADVEAGAPGLRRTRVTAASLGQQMARAIRMRDALRGLPHP